MNVTELQFDGPFSFLGGATTIESIPPRVRGVYLWCIKGHDGVYRVHYVGEAIDVRSRLRTHMEWQMAGKYTAFDVDKLRRNIKTLAHRPKIGMVGAYKALDVASFNESFLTASEVFYANLGEAADKSTRCKYESALCMTIEDYGQNILHIGGLRGYSMGTNEVNLITPGGVRIEAITDGSLWL